MLRLIIDRTLRQAQILSRMFREVKLGMCKCSHECYHKRFQAKAKSLNRIFDRYVNTCDEATKLHRMKQLRALYTRYEVVEIELILDWISENGRPGDLNSACHDVLQWAVANDLRQVLAKAKERQAIELKLTKPPRETVENLTEAAAASSEEKRLLALFAKEYPSAEDRRRKIAAELSQIRIDFQNPELSESREILTYALARICRRIELALPMLERSQVG